jgi:lambda repressor-like predicted transcriptional regulator
MNHAEIKAALSAKGLTFIAIATASGRNYQTLTACSMRKCTSYPAASVIALALEQDVTAIFPDVPQYKVGGKKQHSELALKKAQQLFGTSAA